MPARRFLVVSNQGAGSGGLLDDLASVLPETRTIDLSDDDLPSAIASADDEERVVVASGGDGTVHAVVQHLAPGQTLGVLPAGTLNHFATDLGVQDPQVALDALRRGRERRVDLGSVNGERFVNNISLGLYPEMVRFRESLEDTIGKWPAMVVAAARAAIRTAPVNGVATADGDAREIHGWVVFVGNNRFEIRAGSIGTRERLDEGVLDVRILAAKPRSRAGLRAWRASRGAGYGGRRIRTSAQKLGIRLRNPRRLASDGEDVGVTDSLDVESLPGALSVLAPD